MITFRLVSVVHVFMFRDNELLLLRRYNTGHEDGNYGVPSGRLDGGEEVKSAAIREVKEECNLDPFVKQALDNYQDGIWFSSHGWK